MAGLMIQRCHQTFPPGTVVQARPEAKVQSTVPHLSFTGLDPSTFYVLTGVVGGQLRRIQAMSEAA